jgi:hypothetical protein
MNRDPAPHHPLVQRLIDARHISDALFSIVKPEYLYERPIRERHRIVFYIGHLEAFDRNLFDERLCPLPAFARHPVRVRHRSGRRRTADRRARRLAVAGHRAGVWSASTRADRP